MPGIVGLITQLPRAEAEDEFQRMLQEMWREPLYVTGTWIDESMGIYVGWNAHRNSMAANMPLYNETGNLVLVFSGEEFPAPSTQRRLLKARGHKLGPEALSYPVPLDEEDNAFLAELNGRFHGLLIHKAQGRAVLFNDRYGMHRLYWHRSKDAFYFAAEAKAILAVRPELRRADPRGLGELVACGCVLENRTVFHGIEILPPASRWSFLNGLPERQETYFQPGEWEDQEPLTEEAYYQDLKDVFSQNLPRYFQGPQKIGMSLTGGLDTRMIMAWQKPPPGSLPCYSFADGRRDTQDVRIAREVARVCEQSHEAIAVKDEFLSRFAHYAERTVYASDGCAGVDCAADLYLNEQAARIAPVRMTGNYGSEVLRNVCAFKPVVPAPDIFVPELGKQIQAAADTYRDLLHCHPLSFAVFRQAPWHHYGLLAVEQTQLTLRSPFLDNELVKTAFRAPDSTVAGNNISLQLIADGNRKLREFQTDRGLAGNGGITSAISRSLRQFTFKAEYACDYGMPQWAARIDHFLSPLPERLLLGRHKFCHYRIWYRDKLSGYIQEVLLDSQALSRPYLDRKMLEVMVRHHVKGDRNYTTAIHKVLTLELLHRLFLDGR